MLHKNDFSLVREIESRILDLTPVADDNIIKYELDRFYWQQLPSTSLGLVMRQVRPVGGQRKVEALERFATRESHTLAAWAAIGDSITDFKMLQAVDQAGGLAIAFNANEYVLPYATMSLASTHLDDLWPVLEAWQKGGRQGAETVVQERETSGGHGDRGYFHWLPSVTDLSPVLELHQKIRRLVRSEAAELG